MKTLILMRHAEADQGGSDYSRPLSARGLEQCALVATTLGQAELPIDAVLCSSAPRARRTAEYVAHALACAEHIEAKRELYEADASQYLRELRATPAHVNTLLFVAHNPSVSDLVSLLTGKLVNLATAEYVVLELLSEAWSELGRVNPPKPKPQRK